MCSILAMLMKRARLQSMNNVGEKKGVLGWANTLLVIDIFRYFIMHNKHRDEKNVDINKFLKQLG
jgi:hypothetical protein